MAGGCFIKALKNNDYHKKHGQPDATFRLPGSQLFRIWKQFVYNL